LQQLSGRDEQSIVADAQFIDPARGDYRVKDDSPALALGFVNFAMDRFGVRKPELKAIARTPVMPGQRSATSTAARDITSQKWLEATVRNVADQGEMSALGLPGVTGVLVLEVPARSVLARAGLQPGDVILSVNGVGVGDIAALQKEAPALVHFQTLTLGISRQQRISELSVTP
jgi:S1-C subfamily serine protease